MVTSQSRTVTNLVRAYKVYVRPLLEYCPQVWSPYQKNLINKIEKVQRSFSRRIPGLQNISYRERLTTLKLQSLEHRRLISDLITCFNIVHGLSSLTFTDFFTFSPSRFCTRGHPLRLSIPLTKKNSEKFVYSSRVILPWNSLPDDVVGSPSTQSFKSKLLKIDLSKFLTFPCLNHVTALYPTSHSI